MEHVDHSWYAIRISGQGARVSRRRIIFAGPKGGTHQYLVPDINQKSNIEVALDDLGIDYFIPMAIEEVPHRRKRGVMVTRRVPLIPGYAFVQHVADWQALEDTDGVAGVLKCGQENVRIPNRDIHALRMIEWDCFCNYVDPPKDRARRRFMEGSRHVLKHRTIGLMDVTVISVTGRNTIKAIADRLGKVEFAVDDVEEAA